MTDPAELPPIITRLPEALELEAEAIAEAEALQFKLEREREAATSDEERLARESQ